MRYTIVNANHWKEIVNVSGNKSEAASIKILLWNQCFIAGGPSTRVPPLHTVAEDVFCVLTLWHCCLESQLAHSLHGSSNRGIFVSGCTLVSGLISFLIIWFLVPHSGLNLGCHTFRDYFCGWIWDLLSIICDFNICKK